MPFKEFPNLYINKCEGRHRGKVLYLSNIVWCYMMDTRSDSKSSFLFSSEMTLNVLFKGLKELKSLFNRKEDWTQTISNLSWNHLSAREFFKILIVTLAVIFKKCLFIYFERDRERTCASRVGEERTPSRLCVSAGSDVGLNLTDCEILAIPGAPKHLLKFKINVQ